MNRDTHDIEAYERELAEELAGTNIQPALLIKLMIESEPCLFSNTSEPVPVQNKPIILQNPIWREE